MGRAPCCDKASVKKGPWSPEEDRKLKEYIHNYGTGGNWISLPHKAGLKRCGKSCRLRWLNYLRPNIKHGSFSEEEDRIICSLFATIGSRWSIIAAQLPGRTDNDIKNYWNTKLKKKLMQAHGLQPLTARSSHHRCKKQQQQQHLFVSAEALSSSAPTSGDHLLSSLQHLSTPVHNFPHHNGSQCYDNNSSTSSLLMFGGNGDEQQLMMNSSPCPDSVGSGLGLYFEFCNNDGSSHGHDSAVAASLAMESLILQQDDHDKAPSLLAGDHQYGANTFCYEEAKPLVNVTAGDGGSNGDGDSMFYSSSSSPTPAGVSRQGSFMY